MKNNLIYVAHNMIEKNPLNVFPVTDDDVEVLQAQIDMEGLLTPLTLIGPYENGKYRLISGECRWSAIGNLIKEGKWEGDIPCLIINDISMSDNMQKYRIISANTDNRDLGEKDKIKYVLQMFKCLKDAANDGEISEDEITKKIAKAMNKSQRTGQYYAQIFSKGSEKLVEHLTNDEIGTKEALKVIRNTNSTEEQDELINEMDRTGKKVDEIISKETTESSKSEPVEEKPTEEQVEETKLSNAVFQSLDNVLEQQNSGKSDWNDSYDDEGEIMDDDALLRDMENKVAAKQTFSASNTPDYSDSATQAVVRYCEKLLNKEELTDEEYEVVNKMEEVVSRFLV